MPPRKEVQMKIEMRVDNKVLLIESDGPVTVTLRDDVPVYPLILRPVTDPDAAPSPLPEAPLFSKLCDLRKELASEQGVPPYVIFHDKTLRAMADSLPQDMASLAKLPGIGQSKLDKYGDRFLAVLQGAAV